MLTIKGEGGYPNGNNSEGHFHKNFAKKPYALKITKKMDKFFRANIQQNINKNYFQTPFHHFTALKCVLW